MGVARAERAPDHAHVVGGVIVIGAIAIQMGQAASSEPDGQRALRLRSTHRQRAVKRLRFARRARGLR
jgi:hypothetical protein